MHFARRPISYARLTLRNHTFAAKVALFEIPPAALITHGNAERHPCGTWHGGEHRIPFVVPLRIGNESDKHPMSAINVAILAGGTSGERPISLQTAAQMARWLQGTRYTPWIIDVQYRDWQYTAPDGECTQVDKNDFSLPLPQGRIPLHVALLATHGTPGENGLLQGYLELMQIPYSTGSTFAQALSFHKAACKHYLTGLVPMAPAIELQRGEPVDAARIIAQLGLPLFIKPNDNGSSVGVSKAHTEAELTLAIEEAFRCSSDLLIEGALTGTEVSCGIVRLGGELTVLPITEIVPPDEFFNLQSKYDGSSQEITPARIAPEVAAQVGQYTRLAYQRLQCRGFARVDYIVVGETPYFLEINTVPGMTAESILPRQVACAGRSMTETLCTLLDELITPSGR